MRSICVIPARSGSKGIQDKNIQLVGNKTLLDRAVMCAIDSGVFSDIIVSSDSEEYLKAYKDWLGVAVSKRPKHLSGGEIHSSVVVNWEMQRYTARTGSSIDIVCMMLPTSPFRNYVSIAKAVSMIQPGVVDSIVGVWDSGKYINNLRYLDIDHRLISVSDEIGSHHQRQGLKKIYQVTGSVFVASGPAFLREKTFHMKNTIGLEIGYIEALDVNSMKDLEIARDFERLFHAG